MLHRVSDAEAHLYKESRMEVMLQCPNGFSSNLKKKKKLLPLSQLAEDMRGTGVVSHHLLETSMTVNHFQWFLLVNGLNAEIKFHAVVCSRDKIATLLISYR